MQLIVNGHSWALFGMVDVRMEGITATVNCWCCNIRSCLFLFLFRLFIVQYQSQILLFLFRQIIVRFDAFLPRQFPLNLSDNFVEPIGVQAMEKHAADKGKREDNGMKAICFVVAFLDHREHELAPNQRAYHDAEGEKEQGKTALINGLERFG